MRVCIDKTLGPLVSEWQTKASDRLGAAVGSPGAVIGLALRVSASHFEAWLDALPGVKLVSDRPVPAIQHEEEPEPSIDPVLERLSTVLSDDF